MRYRRAKTPGATYFFTVVTHNRQPLFHEDAIVALLRKAFHTVMAESPFTIDAIVVLPDHLHSIWTLPKDDADYSSRWRRIKSRFSRWYPDSCRQQQSLSRLSKGEKAIWQRRFWEHQIRDDADFRHHVDYVHYNPVKHGLVKAPRDWSYSSFHRYVEAEAYSADWGMDEVIQFDESVGRE